jgi:hypothetical protein
VEQFEIQAQTGGQFLRVLEDHFRQFRPIEQNQHVLVHAKPSLAPAQTFQDTVDYIVQRRLPARVSRSSHTGHPSR